MKEYFVWLAKFVTIVVVLLVGVPVLMAAVAVVTQGTIATQGVKKQNAVAVVEIGGVVMGSKEILESLYKHADDKNIKGIVVRIDSPGGAVGPAQEIYEALRKIRDKKPVVASMGAVAASGGMYIALGASKIFAQPGTLSGSIGVILQIPNFSEIAEKVGFKMVTIKSGAFKDVGNSFRAMSEDERRFLESVVDTVHAEFVNAVVESRELEEEQVKAFADGRIIVGSQAKEFGLVDEYGGVHEAARAVFEELGRPLKEDEEPTLVYTEDKWGHLKKFLETVLSVPEVMDTRVRLLYLMQ